MIWKALFLAIFVMGVCAYDPQQSSEKIREVIGMVCQPKSTEGAITKAQAAMENFLGCFDSVFNMTVVRREFFKSMITGDTAKLFTGYCLRSPQVVECYNTLVTGVSPCLNETLRNEVTYGMKSLQNMLDYNCNNDGERIIAFIRDGYSCVGEKARELEQCVPDEGQNPRGYFNMNKADRCTKLEQLSQCSVLALQGCKSPTAANYISGLLGAARDAVPCEMRTP